MSEYSIDSGEQHFVTQSRTKRQITVTPSSLDSVDQTDKLR